MRSFQRELKDILDNRIVTKEVLGTTRFLVEQSLKARLIKAFGFNPRNKKALNPNQFSLWGR